MLARSLASVFAAGTGLSVAEVATSPPPDLAGIAALITALSGLAATIGAIYLGSRKRGADATDKMLQLLLEREARAMKEAEDAEDDTASGP